MAVNVSDWPLVLCGPMLRRVTPNAVSIFVATKHARRLVATVSRAGTATPLATGEAKTQQIGRYCHVAVVTAVAAMPLEPGINYQYDLSLAPSGERDDLDRASSTDTLESLGLLRGEIPLGYTPGKLPSFALPPGLAHLRIAHGSCRKPHGQRRDAFLALDFMIRQTRDQPLARPHQLFLTGDQIYADDVADPLLTHLTAVGNELLDWGAPEQVPGLPKAASDIPAGSRAQYVVPPFTSGAARSHLITFGEFCAMYLCTWCEAVWPAEMPSWDQLVEADRARYGEGYKDRYQEQLKLLRSFRNGLDKVRRALANVPTYMQFDDHDVTDDWFLDRKRHDLVQAGSLGQRIVVNALAAFAIFQAWGNTPDQFEPSQVGASLLDSINRWRGADDATFTEIAKCVQVPATPKGGLRWDYEYRGPEHHVIVLDTRTQRAYPSPDLEGAPDLMSSEAIQRQVSARRLPSNKPITIVVSPAVVVGHALHEWLADKSASVRRQLTLDRETWRVRPRPSAIEALFRALMPFERVILLSGDVHYSSSTLVHYWDGEQTTPRLTILQLTSSAFKNEDGWTRAAGSASLGLDELAAVGGDARGPRIRSYFGWAQPPAISGQLATRERVRTTPALLPVPLEDPAEVPTPDWRYRIELLTDTRPAAERGLPEHLVPPQTGGQWMLEMLAAQAHLGRYDQMRTVVGHNNVAVLSFDAADVTGPNPLLVAHQDIWFRLLDDADDLVAHTSHAADLTVQAPRSRPPTRSDVGLVLPNLSAWAELISFRPPAAVQRDVIRRFSSGGILNLTKHRIERGFGAINLDYYPVRVTVLPSLAEPPITAHALLRDIRRALNSFVDFAPASFDPWGQIDRETWDSENPVGAVLSIPLVKYLESASVVTSDSRHDRWVFSTVWTPVVVDGGIVRSDLGHPVSGNRAFGYVSNPDGSSTFYTRGADRATGVLDQAMHMVIFNAGDALWRSFQRGIRDYVRERGGVATIEPKHSVRYSWDDVKAAYWKPVEDWVE